MKYAIVVLVGVLMAWATLSTIGNMPMVDIVPCTTDIDCMRKNPNIAFSLEAQ